MSTPPRATRPASGRSKPALIRNVVVFPEPDGPSSVKNSPSPTFRSTSWTATTSPYVFRMPSTPTSAAKAPLQDVETALELFVTDREGDEDADHVAVDAAREEQQALLAGLARDPGRLVTILLRQLERHHRAEAAHLGAVGRHRGQALVQAAADRLGARAPVLDGVEDRERGRARQRIAAEGAAETTGRNR